MSARKALGVDAHQDLSDLHMKYDVTKQEINFFQSKLKDCVARSAPAGP